jgi:hypothetical protein
VFVDVYNAINAQFQALVTAAQPSFPAFTFGFGPVAVRTRGTPPRLSWGFLRDKFTAARLQGTGASIPGRPRSLKTRVEGFELHLWAPNQQFSPVTAQGLQQGSIVPSTAVDPNTGLAQMMGFFIQIVAGGATGTATFNWSSDSGQTMNGPLTTGASVALGSTQVSIAFSGTFQAGDTYRFVANDLVVNDYATTEWCLEKLVTAIHQKTFGSYELMGGHWSNQDSSDLLVEGVEYVLDLELEVPILESSSPAVSSKVITSILQTDIIGNTTTIP